ncbi:MAG: hypothetical protein IKC59_03280, partial [Clostridia bacterium]|nr:hypothetical protein [Clostridia bacterium]
MKKKVLSLFLVLSMLVGMLAMMPISVGAADEWSVWDGSSYDVSFFSDNTGNGTADNPYKISSAAQWVGFVKWSNKEITADVPSLNDWYYFELTTNLKFNDGSAEDWFNETSIPANTSLEPAFDEKKAGRWGIKFNGENHTISGVYMNTGVAIGLFGNLWGEKDKEETSTVVENLTIENSYFTGGGWIGSLLGETAGSTIVRNVYVKEDVYVNSTGNVSGGIVGGCYHTGPYTVTINDCVFEGTLISEGTNNGGIIGNGNSSSGKLHHIQIENCLVTGSVSGGENTSGIVGGNNNSATTTIKNSIYAGKGFSDYPFGKGTANSSVFTVENSYTTEWGTNGAAYVTKQSTESTNGVTKVTIDELTGLTAIKISGFTRRDGAIMLPSGIIGEEPEEPATLNGSGTEADPYKIGSAEDWAIFETLAEENTFAGEYIELTADIDFDGIGLHPVFCEMCGEEFQGTFNGAGKTISNFKVVTNEDSASLFGLLADGAVVKNLVIKNATVNSGQWTGIIAGGAIGTVEIANIYVDKDVTLDVDGYCGGILGGAYGKAESVTVKNCVFAGTIVSDGNYVAGIVGNGNSKPVTITNCMNLGTIEGSQYVAGISTSGAKLTITKCINIGKISGDFCVSDIYSGNPSDTSVSVTSNYWMTKMISVNTKPETTAGGTVTTGSNKRIELTDLIGEAATLPEGFTGRAGDLPVPTAIKDLVPMLLTIQLYDGASVRLDLPTGLRFTALLGNDFLKTFADGATFGIIIAPTDYIDQTENKEFTVAALDALGMSTDAYVKIPAISWGGGEEAGYYEFTGVLANVKDYNYTRAFSARAYIEVDGEIVYYSAYDSKLNSRTIAAVGEAAYNDTKTTQDDEYQYEIAPNAGVYSPYTTTQRNRLPAFFEKVASNINFMSYNIRNVEGGDSLLNDPLTFEYDGRDAAVVDYIITASPDVIGLQEVSVKTHAHNSNSTLSWWDSLEDLESAGYACFVGNNILPESDNKEMYNPIYYKANKYEFVTSGFYYLSDDNTQKAVDGEYRGCT